MYKVTVLLQGNMILNCMLCALVLQKGVCNLAYIGTSPRSSWAPNTPLANVACLNRLKSLASFHSEHQGQGGFGHYILQKPRIIG